MNIITTPSEMRTYRQSLPTHETVGFVPTMGCLHDGHASLLKQSVADNDKTILSIFINPTQFNNASDLNNYPKTIEADCTLAKKLNVDAIFIPTYESLYPDHYTFKIETCDDFSSILEGASRPGHYAGVLSIVMKLLNIIKPTRSYFGEKDFQQYQLIKRMAEAFFLDGQIIMCPTKRETSNLAMSSRNTRLSQAQRQTADSFAKIFHQSNDVDEIKMQLSHYPITIDYIEKIDNRLFAAIFIDDIRLIDTYTTED